MKRKVFKGFFGVALAACLLLAALPVSAITAEEVPDAVAQIRSWYYGADENPNVRMEYSGDMEGRELEYYFYKDELFFVYGYKDGQEWRLYFKDNELIRFIGPDGEVVDYPQTAAYEDWKQNVLWDAYNVDYWEPEYQDKEEKPAEKEVEARLCVGKYVGEDIPFYVALQYFPPSDTLMVHVFREMTETTSSMAWKTEDGGFGFVADPENPDRQRYVYFWIDTKTGHMVMNDYLYGESIDLYRTDDYVDEDYEQLAKYFYHGMYHDVFPPVVEVEDISYDGTVTIHLYEEVSDGPGTSHTATWDWYYVDEETLQGENFMGEKVNLWNYGHD